MSEQIFPFITDHLESQIERALRDFKHALEGGRGQGKAREAISVSKAAGKRRGKHLPASAGRNQEAGQGITSS